MFAAYSADYGLTDEQALKLSESFGGGMALGETCGTVTGAFMVLGLEHGRIEAGDAESKQKTKDRVREFAARFEQVAVERPTDLGDGYAFFVGQVLPGDGLGAFPDFFGRTFTDNLAALDSGGRPQVDYEIGLLDGFPVVFHHQDSVADIAQVG